MERIMLNIEDGKFVTVTFKKKDGSIRTLTGRSGVKKYLKGGKSTLDPNKFFILYSVQDKGYRAIAKDRILAVKSHGEVYDPYHLWD
jgi:hypothetical protein